MIWNPVLEKPVLVASIILLSSHFLLSDAWAHQYALLAFGLILFFWNVRINMLQRELLNKWLREKNLMESAAQGSGENKYPWLYLAFLVQKRREIASGSLVFLAASATLLIKGYWWAGAIFLIFSAGQYQMYRRLEGKALSSGSG